MSAGTEVLRFEVEGDVGVLTIQRPHKGNSVDDAVLEGLEDVVTRLDAPGAEVRSVVLTGAGSKVFCTGGDLDYFRRLETRKAGAEMSRRMTTVLDRLWSGPQVVIAAIQGSAMGGGCEILTACHVRIAWRHSTFAFVQAQNGLTTGWGGGLRLIHVVGDARAMRLLLTAEQIDAEEALRIGLVDRLVDEQAAVLPAAKEDARLVCKNDPGSIQGFFELARAMRGSSALEKVRKKEKDIFGERWTSKGFRSRLAARAKK